MDQREKVSAMTDDSLDPALRREVEAQMRELRRGAVQILSEAELAARIADSIRQSRPLRVKLGVDPTAHDLHLGFTLPLTKLRRFCDLGHLPVLIIGDATAMVGDPAGRNKGRPQLGRDEVEAYAASYLRQVEKILDLDKVEVRRNGEWLDSLGFQGFIKLASKSTVARMLERDDFAKRFAGGVPIHIHEFIYPLMQGYDSVVVRADVEIGGQDQLFNLLMGRDLQADAGQAPQICMMGPLLRGLDGEKKMSKSFGNAIGISESPTSMFGKVMSIPDEMMEEWYQLLTMAPLEEIDATLRSGRHPRELKDELARRIVARFHDAAAAHAASDEFRRVFSEKQLPDEIPEFAVAAADLEDGASWVVRLVVASGCAPSQAEARRLVRQGAVSLDGVVVTDEQARLAVTNGAVLKVGKRRFVRLVRRG